MRLQKAWKKQAVALSYLRHAGKRAVWYNNARIRALALLRHRAAQALAIDFLRGRVYIARRHLRHQAETKKLLIARAIRAQVHCDRQEAAIAFLRARVAHERKQQDALVYLQCSATIAELVDASARAGVVHQWQTAATAFLRGRARLALEYAQDQKAAMAYLFGWGCRVLSKATPEELQAAVMLQQQFRARIARKHMRMVFNSMVDKTYDPTTGRYYYANKKTGTIRWQPPAGMTEEEMLTPRSFAKAKRTEEAEAQQFTRERRRAQRLARGGFTEAEAATLVQRQFRTRIARKHFRLLLNSTIDKVYDESSGLYYYFNKKSGAVTWDKPKGMGDQELLTPRSFAAKAEEEGKAQEEFIRNRKLDAQEAERAQAKAARAAKFAKLDASAAEDAAARVLQGCWRMRSARNGVVELIRSMYKLCYDPSSGKYYYLNTRTNEAKWEKPLLLGPVELEYDYSQGYQADVNKQVGTRNISCLLISFPRVC